MGRGTAVDRETVVDSKAASVSEAEATADFLRISDPNMLSERPFTGANRAKMGLYGQRG